MGLSKKIAVFGGGCFWCTEAVFHDLKGVFSVTSGYAGGRTPSPTYDAVSSGGTGHAEVIRVEYDPRVISYNTLLKVFFSAHDPTTVNRQGPDVGEQYRSIILYKDDEQKTKAEEYIRKLNDSHAYTRAVVTSVEPLDEFFSAEEYHQNYFKSNPGQPYCSSVIRPKIKKFREKFAHLLKDASGEGRNREE